MTRHGQDLSLLPWSPEGKRSDLSQHWREDPFVTLHSAVQMMLSALMFSEGKPAVQADFPKPFLQGQMGELTLCLCVRFMG